MEQQLSQLIKFKIDKGAWIPRLHPSLGTPTPFIQEWIKWLWDKKEKFLGILLRSRLDGVLTKAKVKDRRVDGVETKSVRKLVY